MRRKADGQVLCRKEINYHRLQKKEREQLQAEFSILESLKHKNIVRYSHHERHDATGDVYLYMEYCGGGDLGTVIKRYKRDSLVHHKRILAPEDDVWRILSQLLSALYRCHYGQHPPPAGARPDVAEPKKEDGKEPNMILHRDIKPENIFLGEDNVVKLGDFGLSKLIGGLDFASTYVGTPFYMSPEIYNGEKYTLEADVWAVGCLIYELCTHEPPFPAKTQPELVEKVLKGSTGVQFQADFRKTFKSPANPNAYSEELQKVILDCLKPNPRSRPKTFELLGVRSVWIQRKQQELEEWEERLKQEQLALEAKRKQMEQEMQTQMQKELKKEMQSYRLRIDLQMQQKLQADLDRMRGLFEKEVSERVTIEVAKGIGKFKFEASRQLPLGDVSEAAVDTGRLSQAETLQQSIGTSTSPDDDYLTTANTSFDSLSIQTSPNRGSIFEKKAPQPKRQRTAITRSLTQYESPADIQMSDPSPMSISSLNLSPRRQAAAAAANTHFPRGNIFAEAEAARQKWEPRLAYTTDEEEDEDEAEFLNEDSPIRPKATKATTDPMKPPPPNFRGRPGLMRQHTTAAIMQSTRPNLLPTKRTIGTEVRAALASATGIPRSATESNLLKDRPGSPTMKTRRLSKIPSSANLKADANANANATSPKRGLVSKLVSVSKDDMLKAALNRNLGGKTLVELSQERQMRGVVAEVDRDAPVWDPEVCGEEAMPSPFLKRDVRNVNVNILGVGHGNVVRGLR